MKIKKSIKWSALIIFVLVLLFIIIPNNRWFSSNLSDNTELKTKIVNLEENAAKSFDNEKNIDMSQFAKKNIEYTIY
jgi:hypothetical protein